MGLLQILSDERINSYIRDVRKIGERARIEGKVYELCTEDNNLNEYVKSICIYSSITNLLLQQILYSAWWKGYRNE